MRFFKESLLIPALFFMTTAVSCQNSTSPATSVGQEKGAVVNVNLNVNAFAALLDTAQADGVLLDVRTQGEFAQGHIKGAKQVDFYQSEVFRSELEKMDRETPVYVYCRSGARSGNAAQMMKQMGFTKVYNLQGGMNSWQRSQPWLASQKSFPTT